MKAVIIDHDEVNWQFLAARLKLLGHQAHHEADKHKALEFMAKNHTDVVFYDPAPLTSARPLILNIRRSVDRAPYICLTGSGDLKTQALASGAQDGLSKPFDPEALESVMNNAGRLNDLSDRLSDSAQDFPSAGGVISKSAFNQLFLSALDRSDRYAERSYMLVFDILNTPLNPDLPAEYAADYGSAKLAQHLVLMRRQSDIIGQIGPGSYALLLQRPAVESEPQDAAARFADALMRKQDLTFSDGTPLRLNISLLELPSGKRLNVYEMTLAGDPAS